MSEEEDKPKPEGEQPSEGEEERKRRRKEKKAKRKKAKLAGKSFYDLFVEVSGKSFDELVVEIFMEAAKIIRLVTGDNDWDDIEEEVQEKVSYISYLQTELVRRPKKAGDYKKWAEAVTIERQASLVVQKRDIVEAKKLFDEELRRLNDFLESNKLPTGELLQLQMIINFDRMIFENSKSSEEGRQRSIENSIPTFQFQGEAADTMLKVREEQAKTATILEKVEGRLESSEQVQAKTAKILEKVAENTNPAQQFILIVAASALVAISFGLLVDIIFLKWNDEIKEHWVAATLSVIVIGVFAILAIKKWVFGKN